MSAEPGPAPILGGLLAALDQEPAGDLVTFDGADPVFPTPVRIGDAGAAAIAAATLTAARIHADRGGGSQRVTVAVDAAAAAMRSARYLRTESAAAASSPVRGRGLGSYRTRDGRWIYFQRLFPHHVARLLEVLDCVDDEDAIAAAVLSWEGLALEDAVVGNGACAALVRTPREWAAHPQGAAVAAAPLLSVTRIGDSHPQPLPALGDRPLDGLRVLDVTRVLAGPTCGRTFAEHGAQVLRVGTTALPDNEAMMRDTGHGKRSTALNLRAPGDAGRLRELVRGADVFVQGYRPGALAQLGFTPEALVRDRPGLVVVSLSAFGSTGPWHERRGFDSVIQSASGLVEWPDPEGPPRFLPANPLDYLTGYLAAFGALVGLRRRAVDGGSYEVRVSLAQTGRWLDRLGRVPSACAERQPAELTPHRLAELMLTRDTAFGRLHYLAPTAALSVTPPFWAGPTVPLDHDPPQWA